ncbi:MAG: tryptophan--tRNA ligase [Thiotrichales bacterium]|nr:MAG: tryptophan--tRNA ligase [Thiotrichales bacterium]
MSKKVLTGITPSGIPHIGNYIGAIKPAIEFSKQEDYDCFYFIADYHSLIKLHDPKLRKQYTREIATTWLALGLDPKENLFYRQSCIPEILELTWILSNVTAKGLLNRAHAYKAQLDINKSANNSDIDSGIYMGLYNYPVLMAADILIFNPDLVPVGKDQIQHIEIARDIAQRFNHIYGEVFKLPKAIVDQNTQTIPGLDGRKMSKSYNNTIPIFSEEKSLRKLIMKIQTNSQLPEEPKDTANCTLFAIYKTIATEAEISTMRKRYTSGIGWGDMKKILFEKMADVLKKPRENYKQLLENPDYVETVLQDGALKARELSRPMLEKVRKAIGIQ